MVICDTNILIELFKNNNTIKQKCIEIGIENLSISAITAGEFYFGALNKNELIQIKKHINYYKILILNKEITEIFLNLMIKYSLSHKCHVNDMLIAATALYYDLSIFTLNVRDFKFIPKIKIISL